LIQPDTVVSWPCPPRDAAAAKGASAAVVDTAALEKRKAKFAVVAADPKKKARMERFGMVEKQ